MSFRRCFPALLLSAGLLLGACGDDDVQPEAQPTPVVGGFSEAAFDALPRPATSEPRGNAVEMADTISRSYEVRNTTPEQVLDFYRSQLRDWRAVQGVEKLGVNTYRGIWTKDGAELTVSATSGPTLSQPDEVRAQYSLSLKKT